MAVLAKGADPEALDLGATRLAALATELDGVRHEVGAVSAVLSGQWRGGDLDGLLGRWPLLDARVAGAATTVRRLGETVARNAAQQRTASAAPGGTGPSAAPARPTPGPRPTTDPDVRLTALLAADLDDAQRRVAVRSFFDSLTPAERQDLARRHPAQVGDLSGAPFAERATANRLRAATALAAQDQVVAAARERLASARTDPGLDALPVLRAQRVEEAHERLDDALALRGTYARAADPAHEVVLFDAAHGRYAEVSGRIDAGTRDVAVLVPGTNTTMGDIDGSVARSESFVAAAGGRLAVVTWMGGHLPQGVEAVSARSSEDLAPRLAAFTHDLRQEADLATGRGTGTGAGPDPGSGVRLTLVGHSYGGAVVGLSETVGSDADRVVHVESAGMGHGVWSPAQLHPTEPDVRRYAMTAPGDPIALSQGVEAGDLGHGHDPDTFPGVTRLATGDGADGRVLEGPHAHSGVLVPGSDAWRRILGVLTGP